MLQTAKSPAQGEAEYKENKRCRLCLTDHTSHSVEQTLGLNLRME